MIPTESNGSSAVVISSDESRILNALTRQDAKLEVIIPKEASADELWSTLEICVKGVNYMTGRICRLKPIIGQLLLRFQNKPSLYKGLGYATFQDFKYKGVGEVLGLCRTSIFEAMSLAENWPQVTPDRYEKIGPKKMYILDKFAHGRASNSEAVLQKAESMTVTELRDWAEEKGEIAPGETVPKTIHIHTTLEIYRHWVGFCQDENVQALVRSSDPGKILQKLLQECQNEWFIQGAGEIAQQKENANDAVRYVDVQSVPLAGAEDQGAQQ